MDRRGPAPFLIDLGDGGAVDKGGMTKEQHVKKNIFTGMREGEGKPVAGPHWHLTEALLRKNYNARMTFIQKIKSHDRHR